MVEVRRVFGVRLVTTGEGTVQMLYRFTLELLKSTNPSKPRGT